MGAAVEDNNWKFSLIAATKAFTNKDASISLSAHAPSVIDRTGRFKTYVKVDAKWQASEVGGCLIPQEFMKS